MQRGYTVRFEGRGRVKEASREATPSRVARLLIADDHALVREGLRTMLSGEEGIEVVAEANNGQQALILCREHRPDLVLMDVRMPVMDGLEATKRIKQEMPKTSVMMVTMHENPDYLFEAVKAGAAGYVLKDASGERILGAVRRSLEGSGGPSRETPEEESREGDDPLASHPETAGSETSQPEASHSGAHQAGSRGSGQSERAVQIESLTPREIEVLKLLSQGQTNPQIAQNLLVSRGTVKIHVQHIISKLGVSDRTQAAVRAIEAGLL